MDVEKEKDKKKAGEDKGKKDGDKKKPEEEAAAAALTTGQLAADEVRVGWRGWWLRIEGSRRHHVCAFF
jgi:hypothetical protein